MNLQETSKYKILRSEEINYNFDKKTGLTLTWGKTFEDDPSRSPYGPLIFDIEVSTICNGIGQPCKHCCKSNTNQGVNMSFETYKKILDKILNTRYGRVLTQVAFGIGEYHSNPDLEKIMTYTRDQGVIPNITVTGYKMTDEDFEFLAKICGAVSVSLYSPKDLCYNTVYRLTKTFKLSQCNIHSLVSQESLQACHEVLEDIKTDERLELLNSLVFLMLKKKGRGQTLNSVSKEEYKDLILKSLKLDKVGMDSCSAPSFMSIINDLDIDKEQKLRIFEMSECCESGLFSLYCSAEGRIYPCSFCEKTEGWEEGIDILEAKDFIDDIWNHPKILSWVEKLQSSSLKCQCSLKFQCRSCPIYSINLCKS